MKNRGSCVLAYTLTLIGALAIVHWGSRAVTVVSEQIPLPRNQCIILDAGHGGVDGGATSCTGKLESHYNLEISLRLRDLLEFLGYQVKMVRCSDESVYRTGNTIAEQKISDLKERVKLVNKTNNGILISIHQNLHPDPGCFGAQVLYAETSGSKELANILQSQLARSLKPSTRRKTQLAKDIYLLNHINRTGILLECGFISNVKEEARLSSDNYQRQLCIVISSALGQFLG